MGTVAMDAVLEPIRDDLQRYRRVERQRKQTRLRTDPLQGAPVLPESVLAPYEQAPADLLEAGFEKSVLRMLGIGFDRAHHRTTYPIRDGYGNLLGVSGRQVVGGGSRYRVYRGGYLRDDGERVDGDFGPEFDQMFPGYELKSHEHLWNAHNVLDRLAQSQRSEPLILVEGFKAAIWLIQHGYHNVVALMGSSLGFSPLLILGVLGAYCPEFVLFLDNDAAGVTATERVGQTLLRNGYPTLVAAYPDLGFPRTRVNQPDDMREPGLQQALVQERKGFSRWHMERHDTRHDAGSASETC